MPCPDEDCRVGVQLHGSFRHADWSDAWGVGRRTTLAEFELFAKVRPAPDLDGLAD